MGAISVILQLVAMLPTAIQSTKQIIGLVSEVKEIVASGREPSADDWNRLNGELDVLTAQLNTDPT